ncbi:MAG TPA: apolipoprotein N-acyltransferase [Gammaproteobacteria bacterium]|nr:apolipoprotein N-acyltransferase [Gammaproteobacteria bacterium]
MSPLPEVLRRIPMLASEWRAGAAGDAAAALLGALLVLAFAPYGVYPLAVLAPTGLLWLIASVSPRRAAWRGFLFGAAEFACGVHWIYISLHDMGGLESALAVLMLAALVAIMALYSAAACTLSVRYAPAGGGLRTLVLFPAAWTLLEWVRGWFLTGFPWLSLGYSQADGPLRGYASLVGVYGVGFCVLLTSGLLQETLARGRYLRRRLALLAVLVGLWLAGAMLAGLRWTHAAGPDLSVSLIQGDVPQDQKWEPEAFIPTLKLYRDLTDAHWQSRLIIWPEAAVPAYQDEVQLTYLDPLEADARKHGTDILLGVPTYDPVSDYYFNSVISLGSSDGTYDKRHLVPFGENFEFLPHWVKSILRDLDLPYSSFTPGAADQPLLKAAGYPIGTSICYEDAFGNEIMRALPQAAFLVNVSNDGWFGNSIALPQHLEIARMRAIETGRYLLRATNTGITAIIDDGGRVLARAPMEKVSVLDGTLKPLAGATPVTRWGDVPAVALSFLLLLGCAWRNRKRNAG